MDRKNRDQLLEDESFIRFCTRPTETDKSHWAAYLATYPEEWATLEDARLLLVSLFGVLKEEDKKQQLDRLKQSIAEQNPEIKTPVPVKRWLAYAAAVLLPVLIWYQWFGNPTQPATTPTTKKLVQKAADTTKLTASEQYLTTVGEKRSLVLPDGSTVVLNANSSLSLSATFGSSNRTVQLIGEAFFDIKHDPSAPFFVTTPQFTVKVHGTAFNVRAFKGSRQAETALIRGSVEVILPAKKDRSIFLEPNQKLVWEEKELTAATVSGSTSEVVEPTATVLPITIGKDGNSIIETVWTRNSLEINDERFDQLKEKFERWFQVQLVFEDEAIKQYRFTAFFENIPLEQALEAMQLSNSFSYELNDKILKIRSK
ncbi:FecR domain-containing protein [Flavihumibacter sp. RY-1]|uniref:FecR domain-containing protein n=1 Tax=Flavihumibacter fluminis TaxID=2909236 RepID=A0ABS9BLY7_9BACT|nr:FecR domain-containing protein [Flavihumibacter fluminis]MCF1716630.1 FecR domain-containing protein [Flavihumibacter fluminis]